MPPLKLSQEEMLRLCPELVSDLRTAAQPKKAKKHDSKGALKMAWSIFCKDPWPFQPEFRFHPVRRWRLDWAYPAILLGVEVEGVTTAKNAETGRHQTAEGIEEDMVKYNTAAVLGWIVMRYSQRMIKADPKGVVDQIREAIQLRSGNNA